LFNFLRYNAEEKNERRLAEALDNISDPNGLKRFMKKSGIEWVPYRK
jgi:hypothetical protein